MGISDSPRQLVNQLRRASAPAFAKSRLNTPLEAAIACHWGARTPRSNDHIEYSAAVYTLSKEPVAYQTAPVTRATSCNQLQSAGADPMPDGRLREPFVAVHGRTHKNAPSVRARIECSAAVNTLWEWVGAYQTAPGS